MVNKRIFWPFLIFFVYACTLIYPSLGAYNLFDWDEINFAESSREMLFSKNFFQVQVNYEPFHEKPPLFFWLQFLAMKCFGISAFAARFPNALLSILTPLILFKIGSEIKNHSFGLIWGLTYLCGILPNLYFRTGIIDPYFNLFIFLSIYFYYRSLIFKNYSNIIFSGLFTGLATITKGPVGLLIIAIVAFIYFLLSKKKPSLKQLIIFGLLFLFTSSLWYGYEIYNKGPWFLVEFVKYQLDLFSRPVAGHKQPIYYHFLVLLFGCFPFSFFAIKNCIRSSGSNIKFEKIMRVLFWVVLILFSVVTTKIAHYSSLAYFPLSFLATIELYKLNIGKKISRWLQFSLVTFGSLISIFLILILKIFNENKFLLVDLVKDKNFHLMLENEIEWHGSEWLIPIFLLLSSLLWFKSNYSKVIFNLTFFMFLNGIFFSLSSFFIVPKVELMTQGYAINFYKSISKEKKYLTTVGFKSYAHYFYANIDQLSKNDSLFHAKRRILKNNFNVNSLNELNLTDKMRFNSYVISWLINDKIDRPVYFVTKINRSEPQLENSTNLTKIKQQGGYVFYKRELK
tara:strand:+ start:26845 stop:28551 length:1707 start_codon:yes stop_codon:yes gene_type:complete